MGTNTTNGRRGERRRTQTQHYTDDNPATFTTKKKRGQIEKKTEEKPITPNVRKYRRRKRPPPEPSAPEYTILSHHLRYEPIVPGNMEPYSAASGNSVVYGEGLGVPPQLQKPVWNLVPKMPFYFPQDVTNDGRVKQDARAICPSTSCLALSQDQKYLAMGDVCGFVSVYTMFPKLLSFTRLTTSASKRESQEEAQLPPSRKFGVYERKSHPNAIDCLSICHDKIVASTREEIEMVHIPSNTIMWSMKTNYVVSNLDIHPITHDVTCCFVIDNKDVQSNESPLCLLRTTGVAGSHDVNVSEVDARSLNNQDHITVDLGRKCAAMWDRSNTERLLVVTAACGDHHQEQRLLHLDLQSLQVMQQAIIPNKPPGKSGSHTLEIIRQSPQGYYTLVASTRGIRLFETHSFQLLGVFGDLVALHGHPLVFQDCMIIPRNPRQDQFLTCAEKDWIKTRCAVILGVPHAQREPRELQETLHFWDLIEGKQTCATVQAPTKSNGLRSIVYGHEQLIVAAMNHGASYVMKPTLKSDFPGIMYPPGYKVINDNLDYIEDDDEVDVLIRYETENAQEKPGSPVDDQIAEAMRRSIQAEHVADISIADFDENESVLFACHPEPHLREALSDTVSPSLSPLSRSEGFNVAACVGTLPHSTTCGQIDVKPLADMDLRPTLKPVRSKRSKAAVLEALLKSSLLPELRKYMFSREAPTDIDQAVLTPKSVFIKTAKPTECAGKEPALGRREEGESTELKQTSFTDSEGPKVSRILPENTEVFDSALGGTGNAQGAQPPIVSRDPVVLESPMDLLADAAVLSCARIEREGSKSTSVTDETIPEVKSTLSNESHMDVLASAAASRCSSKQTNPIASMGEPENTVEVHPSYEVATNQYCAAVSPSGGSSESESALGAHSTISRMGGPDGELKVSPSERSSTNQFVRLTKYSETESTVHDEIVFASPTSVQGEACRSEGNEITSKSTCLACSGRWVLHVCGYRAPPVDYEAVARAEEEKREKEEAVKKKIRAEKRRLADAKRREAKRKKREEEKRMEMQLNAQSESSNGLEEGQRNHRSGHDRDRMRADMLQRLQDDHRRHFHPPKTHSYSDWPVTTPPAIDATPKSQSLATSSSSTFMSDPSKTIANDHDRLGHAEALASLATKVVATPPSHTAVYETSFVRSERPDYSQSLESSPPAVYADTTAGSRPWP